MVVCLCVSLIPMTLIRISGYWKWMDEHVLHAYESRPHTLEINVHDNKITKVQAEGTLFLGNPLYFLFGQIHVKCLAGYSFIHAVGMKRTGLITIVWLCFLNWISRPAPAWGKTHFTVIWHEKNLLNFNVILTHSQCSMTEITVFITVCIAQPSWCFVCRTLYYSSMLLLIWDSLRVVMLLRMWLVCRWKSMIDNLISFTIRL